MDFSQLAPYELMIMAGLGLLVLLFGLRIKKIAFFIVWFLLGFTLMNYLMPALINPAVPEIANSSLWQTLLPIGGGVIVGLLGFTVEKICVGGIAFLLVILLAMQYFGTDLQTMAIAGIIGIVASGVAVHMINPATIVATSLAGSYVITMSILTWFPDISYEIYYFPMLIGIAVVGTIFQFYTTKSVR